jgi:hypothetical protein
MAFLEVGGGGTVMDIDDEFAGESGSLADSDDDFEEALDREAQRQWEEQSRPRRGSLAECLTDRIPNEFLVDFGDDIRDGRWDRFHSEVLDGADVDAELTAALAEAPGGTTGRKAREEMVAVLQVLRGNEHPLTMKQLHDGVVLVVDRWVSDTSLWRRVRKLMEAGFVRGRGKQNGETFYVAGGPKPLRADRLPVVPAGTSRGPSRGPSGSGDEG